ncbi:hypothetical protein FACHB389_34235 [Nostoc calcicola FACHB-389]|nr:hypothetical protein FACHB389_34235 [Nostoc calcicola FACHB-389]
MIFEGGQDAHLKKVMTILYNAYVLLLKWSVLVGKVNVEDKRCNFENKTCNVEVQRLNLRFFCLTQRRRGAERMQEEVKLVECALDN